MCILIRFPRNKTLVVSLIQKRIEKKPKKEVLQLAILHAAAEYEVFQHVSITNDTSKVFECL